MKRKEEIETDFLSMLEQNIGIIVKISNVYTHSTQDRKDLISDIIFELWKSYPKFRGASAISTWLYRVSLNTALKSKRKKDNDKILFVSQLITFDATVSFDIPEDNRFLINQLYGCIEQLSPINKAIILLYLDEKTNDEISFIMGISKSNVSTRLNRIREQLKQCMLKNQEYGI